ncbi:hypothetical protein NDU88_007203 [Pleurodeles waltl]|uniref:Uncharacterized protein n=1 Tax=Pleurodeles waltl TaxID=8319 RepID=A0AAV7VS43_PLEWA|nr:hypothetical protein NDU88_007203 [Pleurodeles waltl]
MVGVSTPSRHRSEERARLRAARLDGQHLGHEEPSNSWSTGGMHRSVAMEEEPLDYDDGNDSEVLDLVQQKGTEERLVQNKSKRGRSFGIFQETAKRAVRSDCHSGGSQIILSAQGEERKEGMVLGGGVSQTERVVLAAKAFVKDMGVQAGLADNDDLLNKDLTIEVSGTDMGSGAKNEIADVLSHSQWQRFCGLAPGADSQKTAVPGALWELGI